MTYKKVTRHPVDGVVELHPKVHHDERGYFFESFNETQFKNAIKKAGHSFAGKFVQDNESMSNKGVLRGIHYQIEHSQGKLVRVIHGAVYDVAVDLRKGSKTFGEWTSALLNSAENNQLWIPPGCGHAFLTLSEKAKVQYKTTDYYYPDFDRCIVWDDHQLSINWPIQDPNQITVSDKDSKGKLLSEAEVYA